VYWPHVTIKRLEERRRSRQRRATATRHDTLTDTTRRQRLSFALPCANFFEPQSPVENGEEGKLAASSPTRETSLHRAFEVGHLFELRSHLLLCSLELSLLRPCSPVRGRLLIRQPRIIAPLLIQRLPHPRITRILGI